MDKNNDKWFCVQDLTNSKDLIKKTQERMSKTKKGAKSGLSTYKDGATKSFKYIGVKSSDNSDIIKFKSEIYKDVAQNQLNIFDLGA